ncbi:MAG: amidohydrolase family protein [Bacteroidetes bacterium]|nr:amidohydrolase family protein [Bacteroidota bacterium]
MRIFWLNSRKNLFFLAAGLVSSVMSSKAQETFPINDIADPREKIFAFTHATIIKDGSTTFTDATLVIREGKIVSAGNNISIPANAVVTDCTGKFIYPSFIDTYSDYGVAVRSERSGGSGFYGGSTQFNSATKGAYDWNEAIRPETDASKLFVTDEAKAKSLRELGFGTVLTHYKNGIARGTGAVVTLANLNEHLVMIKEKASAHYSLAKGISSQSYPSSMMGVIALLRQSFLDAKWYSTRPAEEGVNLSLQAWLDNKSLPQIIEGNDKWNDLRADRIGDEMGVHFIIKGDGNEYQRIKEMVASNAAFIVPLNFPQAIDVEDPNDARFVSLREMKSWELAPTNPAAFEKANIPICLTTSDLKDVKQFLPNLRKAIDNGLSEAKAFDALVTTPARLLKISDQVGSLDAGKLANFLITTGPVFNEKTAIIENWVQGEKYDVKPEEWKTIKGIYNVEINGAGTSSKYILDVQSNNAAKLIASDTMDVKFSYDGKLVGLSYSLMAKTKKDSSAQTSRSLIRLSGTVNGSVWNGNGEDSSGNRVTWTASLVKAGSISADNTKKKTPPVVGKVLYPFDGYGWEELPKPENLLIKNATVWTNEKEGKLENTDVLVKNGKIVQVGKNISDASAKTIDGTGKHVTPGIIDEHSHIATTSINEGTQSVTSDVRIGDNLNPEDISIYRQLSGGVTSSHILHGSANTIGGQTQLIKLRWGVNDEELKFKNWDPFIKFALGENVKRTSSSSNNRFPDTRMGVEEVLMDAFQRAKDYENALKAEKPGTNTVRRNLKLEALVEIMNKKRFITCHSYVQSEIVALMRVAEKFGFRVNTFTHILEGYKVADKIKEHGASVSTFSDWWIYKMEVLDAIAYNAAIMQKMGLNVCINSDDAEMARRLNQEAAKSVKYGGISEEDALKMITINPAKALHVDDRVGSIKVGKDADLVLWNDNPLSIYAKPLKTIIDGTIYYDIDRDLMLRKNIIEERKRLVQKMLGEKKSGSPVSPPKPSYQILLGCGDHLEHNGLITINKIDDNTTNQ